MADGRTWKAALTIVMCSSWLAQGLSGAPVNPDGVSYLDIASACTKGNWGALVNGVWSPLYAVLLSVLLFLLRPSACWEAYVIRLFNCLILLFALSCFEYFLKGLFNYQEAVHPTVQRGLPLPPWALRAIGYVLFFFASVYMTPASLVNPDALVMAFVLLAAGIILRIRCGAGGTLSFAAFGLVLGLGYLAKTVMFPVGLVFLLAAPFGVRNLRRTIPRVLLAALLFLMVSVPFIFALSKSKGRLTFGETGLIMYAIDINGHPWCTGKASRPAQERRNTRPREFLTRRRSTNTQSQLEVRILRGLIHRIGTTVSGRISS